MFFPFDIHIGPIVIPIHLLTDIAAFYFAYLYYKHLRVKEGGTLHPIYKHPAIHQVWRGCLFPQFSLIYP